MGLGKPRGTPGNDLHIAMPHAAWVTSYGGVCRRHRRPDPIVQHLGGETSPVGVLDNETTKLRKSSGARPPSTESKAWIASAEVRKLGARHSFSEDASDSAAVIAAELDGLSKTAVRTEGRCAVGNMPGESSGAAFHNSERRLDQCK